MNGSYTLGSLFDGSGGFPLSGTLCGIEPVWAAEIEPYPIAVTRSRFPNMKHLGDVSKVRGDEIEPVDVLCFGFPCQDVSVAGARSGVKHETNGDDKTTRSGLLFEAVRIIKEMRGSTNGIYPTFAVLENVPGLFSVDGGNGFRTCLEELIRIIEPNAVMPSIPKAGWAYADSYTGDGWSLAYRVLDAQHIRTAQRRRRVFLVIDLGGGRAREILFERSRLRGHYTPHRTQMRSFASEAHGCSEADDCKGGQADTDHTLNTVDRHAVGYAMQAFGYYIESGRASSIKCRDYKDATDLVVQWCEEKDPKVQTQHIVRRLTPTECARLQGFPDKWGHIDQKTEFSDEEYRFWLNVRNTHAAINGKQTKDYSVEQMLKWYNKLHTDSAEYKMWGNGIALPCALYVMQGIQDAIEREENNGKSL